MQKSGRETAQPRRNSVSEAELEAKEEAELERILDDDWKIFKRKVLDTEMRGVVVTNEQKKIMRMQVSFGNMDVVMQAITTWIAKRSLLVDGLRTWAMWIQEGEPYIREVQQKHRLELRRDLWNRARDRINNISNELRSAGMEFKNAVPVEFWNTLDAK